LSTITTNQRFMKKVRNGVWVNITSYFLQQENNNEAIH
jgi:hypothetical protein